MDAFLLDFFLYIVCSPNNNATNTNTMIFSSIGKGGSGGPAGAGGGPAKMFILKSIRLNVIRTLFEKIFIFLV
jgi:hypothetical protein